MQWRDPPVDPELHRPHVRQVGHSAVPPHGTRRLAVGAGVPRAIGLDGAPAHQVQRWVARDEPVLHGRQPVSHGRRLVRQLEVPFIIRRALYKGNTSLSGSPQTADDSFLQF